jgi:hypothetical protein
MNTILTAAVLLGLYATAFAADDARKDKVTCVLEKSSGEKVSFVIPLKYYDDKDMGAGEEDGAEGTATAAGFKVHYITAAGSVDCEECKTGATKLFFSTLTVSKGKVHDEANGNVFDDITM